MSDQPSQTDRTGLEIAVIGMHARLPGAEDLDAFWRNLCQGVESIEDLTDEELRAANAPEKALTSSHWVRKTRTIRDWDRFDAGFFGISPREADILDPQHRLFLECAWSALEDAGYDPRRVDRPVGVFAGSRFNGYLLNVYSNQDLVARMGDFQVQISNDKDYIATRTSYKLNLGGPSVTVQSACSTALVAVHLGCQALNAGECDMVLAGASGLRVPDFGYAYTEGDVGSPDGRVRPFDAKAKGTMFGSGLSAVVLKRLDDALEDRDTVYAVIRGSAVTNDAAAKVGFSAPGVDGQYRVLRAAQTAAEVDPRTISYVEAHGTGTTLGDPIELEALTRAFRDFTDDRGFCAVGSVKGNIGHLGVAAGGASLIKAVLALRNRQIPPSINFEQPNPQIDFDSSPFFVNTELRPWEGDGGPLRAGVSAFGIGGTNAHIVLEEAPEPEPGSPSRGRQLLVLSGRSPAVVETQSEELARRLESRPDLDLADVAYTLQVGRAAHPHRKAVVCRDREEAIGALRGEVHGGTAVGFCGDRQPAVAFMFSGQGSQYPGMTRGLYESEPVFREAIDRCAEILDSHLDVGLADLLYPAGGTEEEAAELLGRTAYTQPALFAVEHSLALLWRSWGVEPETMIGHSIGEYAAACLAGVFSLEDALALVAARGRLMQELPPGDMLTVPLSEEEIEGRLDPQLAVAAINAEGRSVVSGPSEAVEALRQELEAEGLACRPLHTSHAFHSPMMQPILQPFIDRFEGVELHAPRIPFVSNVTGTWITDEEATDPAYWARHIRSAVRFAAGIGTLLEEEERVLLEVGPGNSLTTLARRHPSRKQEQEVIASTHHPKDRQDDLAFLFKSLGQLWAAGVPVEWGAFWGGERRNRVSLPSYPFERQRFWIDAKEEGFRMGAAGPPAKQADLADWFYLPAWKPSLFPAPAADLDAEPRRWLLFHGDDPLSDRLVEALESRGQRVVVARAAHDVEELEEAQGGFRLAPGRREGFDALVRAVAKEGGLPDVIVHLWNVGGPEEPAGPETIVEAEARAFWSQLFLAQALGKQGIEDPIRWLVVSDGMQRVAGERSLRPEKAALLGPVKVVPLEYPDIDTRSVDLLPPEDEEDLDRTVELLLAEATGTAEDRVVAVRHGERWVHGYEKARLEEAATGDVALRDGGVYLITGGLGGIGLTFAGHLAEEYGARLALVGLSAFPAREQWDDWLETHGARDRTSQKIRHVRALEDKGAEVIALSADVADPEQARSMVRQTVERFGRIDGVVHAAGLAGSGMIQLKKEEAAAGVLGPKVRGTLAIEAALAEAGAEPDFVLLCSSTIACAGGFGQVDYCAANNFLDAWAHAKRLERDGDGAVGRAVSVNWGAWEEVGMAVAAGIVRASAGGDDEPAERGTIHALLDRCVRETADQTIYATDFSPARHWVLSEHRILDSPTLPGTTYLEIARAAFAHHASSYDQLDPEAAVRLRDVVFLGPLMLGPDETREARVFLDPDSDGYKFRVSTRTEGPAGETWQPHVRGRVAALDEPARRTVDLDELRSRCDGETVEFEGPVMSDGEAGVVYWGEHWQSLKTIHLGEDRALARLELPEEYADEVRELALHPALVDVATGIIGFVEEDNFLPLSYGQVTVHEGLPARFYSYLERRRPEGAHTGQTLVVDVTLISEEGEVLVEIEHFAMKKVGEAAANLQRQSEGMAGAGPASQTAAAEGAGTPEATGPTAAPDGILPEEGIEVFRRALSRRVRAPQLVAAAKDLQAMIEQTSSLDRDRLAGGGAPQASAATHDRPSLPTPFVAPRNETEEKLAEIWQAALGIKEIGIHDNFFDLGGDSVMGIQLVARSNEVGFDLSPDQLFEHQTIAELAELVGGSAAGRPAAEIWEEWLREQAAGDWRGSGERWSAESLRPTVEVAAGEPAGERAELVVALDRDDSRRLTEEALEALRLTLEEAALAAFARAALDHGDGSRVLVRLTGDARRAAPEELGIDGAEEPVPYHFPLLVDLEGVEDAPTAELVRRVKEQRRAAPGGGAAWPALLLTADEEERRRLEALPVPRLGLSAQGFAPDEADASPLQLQVREGDGGLELAWSFDPGAVTPEVVEDLAAKTSALLGRIGREGAEGEAQLSPTDFPEAGLDDDDLEAVLSQLE